MRIWQNRSKLKQAISTIIDLAIRSYSIEFLFISLTFMLCAVIAMISVHIEIKTMVEISKFKTNMYSMPYLDFIQISNFNHSFDKDKIDPVYYVTVEYDDLLGSIGVWNKHHDNESNGSVTYTENIAKYVNVGLGSMIDAEIALSLEAFETDEFLNKIVVYSKLIPVKPSEQFFVEIQISDKLPVEYGEMFLLINYKDINGNAYRTSQSVIYTTGYYGSEIEVGNYIDQQEVKGHTL